jgi:hypothetical protein
VPESDEEERREVLDLIVARWDVFIDAFIDSL